MRARKEKIRIGNILTQQGYLTIEQLDVALEGQRKSKKRLGDYLIDEGIVSDTDIAQALHTQSGISLVQLRGMRVAPEIVGLVNGSVLRQHNVFPIGIDELTKELIVAMSDPFDIVAQEDISIITSLSVDPRIATSGEINAILDRYFGAGEAMTAAEEYSRNRVILEEQDAQDEEQNTAPIVSLVRSIIEQAVRQRASDIHFDALEKQVRVRYRVDGVLAEKMLYDINLLPAITTRIKIISGMDISEKRKPQDGRVSFVVDRVEYDMRVSMLPSYYGEKIVMRINSSSALMRGKAELGLGEQELIKFEQILSTPNGILLVTGPTGSGKSTTLYTALSELNDETVNIITVEDPVEASIPEINQVQINTKANLTFAVALRSILRQDPDIIMIGEIRDQETARMAIQAAITGHFVVSTLHTNSAAASVTRLLDMGIESFLLADSLTGIIAQRLVRRLCLRCKKTRLATGEEKQILGVPVDEEIMISEPQGCGYCYDSGFYGRIGVYEIMQINPEIKKIISKSGSTAEIQDAAIRSGMMSLRMSATGYVRSGITTINEMLKITVDT